MKQNREHGNRSVWIFPVHFWQREKSNLRIAFLTNDAGTIGYNKKNKKNLSLNLTSCIKMNSKLDHELKSKIENYKTFRKKKKNKRKNLWDLGQGKFLDLTPKSQPIKGKVDKLDFTKIKNACSMKDPVQWMKRQATGREKIFLNHISDKR